MSDAGSGSRILRLRRINSAASWEKKIQTVYFDSLIENLVLNGREVSVYDFLARIELVASPNVKFAG